MGSWMKVAAVCWRAAGRYPSGSEIVAVSWVVLLCAVLPDCRCLNVICWILRCPALLSTISACTKHGAQTKHKTLGPVRRIFNLVHAPAGNFS